MVIEMIEKRFTFIKDTVATNLKTPIVYNNEKMSIGEVLEMLNNLYNENEQLKKELHLMHMRTMFSTVQSFKGDVSKRYKYSKETDTIYDTANNYGQYDKVLDKAEIVMLLNEYETVLNELKGDV